MVRGITHAQIGQPRHTYEVVHAQVIHLAAVHSLEHGLTLGRGQSVKHPDFIVRSMRTFCYLGRPTKGRSEDTDEEAYSGTDPSETRRFHGTPSFCKQTRIGRIIPRPR